MLRDFMEKQCKVFFITPKQKARRTREQLNCWRGCGHCLADHLSSEAVPFLVKNKDTITRYWQK